MKLVAFIPNVLKENSPATTDAASLSSKYVTALTTARIMKHLMKPTIAVPRTQHVHRIISSARRQTFALNHIGYATAIMIVVTIQTRIRYIVRRERVRKTVSVVRTIVAFLVRGSVTQTMIVGMVQMSRQSTVNKKDGHASVICLRATMETVFHEFISVMATM